MVNGQYNVYNASLQSLCTTVEYAAEKHAGGQQRFLLLGRSSKAMRSDGETREAVACQPCPHVWLSDWTTGGTRR